ncbi:uncharacterized protein LOC106713534 [Papilio machaon]|uniref:uncharacterized protein LOC106713534 n=1 Tax=Papilio machaon TaxID=76193 RepID=UPI001E664DD1|nr:uncharacterized protein LOC106713534 [Papilio machaon]
MRMFLEVFEVVQFDHVICTSTNGLEGRCLHKYECQSSGGSPMGACADGYGTCCVSKYNNFFVQDNEIYVTCGWLINPDFPSPSIDRLACALTLNKTSNDIKQIRLDFAKFELMPPTSGTCDQDQFVVSGQNTNHVIPILCGINTGQHIYIEVGDTQGPIRLTIQTAAPESRLFAIKVTQLKSSDILAAPTGCLQYFNKPDGSIESFNYRNITDIASESIPSYLNNLNYAICIKREKSSCSVTYTNEDPMQIVNYDTDGLPLIPPRQAGVEIFNCPSDWLLISAVRLCGERLNDGSVVHDFYLDAPVTDVSGGPIVVWFRSDEGYVGRGFKLHYQQSSCTISKK